MISAHLKILLQDSLSEPIEKVTLVSGGCSYPSFIINTNRSSYFIKTSDKASQVFQQEAIGLKKLKSYYQHIPEVIAFSDEFLILEHLPSENPTSVFWKTLGAELAKLHQQQMNFFGFYEDNSIGQASQKNMTSPKAKDDWGTFFWENRIEFKLQQLEQQIGFKLTESKYHRLRSNIIEQLNSFPSAPCLLHGDLWSGNILCSTDQKCFLIDPAVYFGDREADIAMTECFSGFSQEFYTSYNQNYPLSTGYDTRKHVYNLYHMLNHYLIFGETYKSTVLNIIAQIES